MGEPRRLFPHCPYVIAVDHETQHDTVGNQRHQDNHQDSQQERHKCKICMDKDIECFSNMQTRRIVNAAADL